MIYRLIAPEWLINTKKVLEGEFNDTEIIFYNRKGYNIYYLPNTPNKYTPGITVTGADITEFKYIFVDYDMKTSSYKNKDLFIEAIGMAGIKPTKIIDSGHGIHVYWKVSNLDAMSYLRFQRRLIRLFNTDEAVGQIFQLMRVPNTMNTKIQDKQVKCMQIYEDNTQYTAEEIDKLLPVITLEDEIYCKQHYDKTYNLNKSIYILEEMPIKFGKLLKDNIEVKELWTKPTDDRSKNDYRLGHLMFSNGFTKEEASSVLINSAKALQRAPIHRQNYAINIVNKIWTYELKEDDLTLSNSVKDILKKSGDTLKGVSFRCHPRIDNTEHGFRLGQVIGLVAGSGVGKTAFALNLFKWFSETNPDYHNFFVPLEMSANEIADRWKTMCGNDTSLHDKVHVMSNYDDNGQFRHLSLFDIREYIEKFQKIKNIKIGCVVIDHIGALKKKGIDGENQDIMDVCHQMKAFAVQTNTILVMQSQSSREKAGIGDLELNKDAAYGTVYFESYCDYLISIWQPLKRTHNEEACPTVTAFKYCKIRHKKAKKDVIQEDTPYYMYFDSNTEQMRDMTQDEITSFNYFLPKATNKRKADRKTEILDYKSVQYDKA